VPSRFRGRFIGSLAGFFAFGFVAAALLGYFLVPPFTDCWRIVQADHRAAHRAGAVVAPRAAGVTALPAGQGRVAEAEAVVAKLERQVEKATGRPLTPVDATAPTAERVTGPTGGGLRAVLWLWRGAMAQQTATTWALWFSITFAYYGFFTFIPSLLIHQA